MNISWLFCVVVLSQTLALPNFVFVLTDDQDLLLKSLVRPQVSGNNSRNTFVGLYEQYQKIGGE